MTSFLMVRMPSQSSSHSFACQHFLCHIPLPVLHLPLPAFSPYLHLLFKVGSRFRISFSGPHSLIPNAVHPGHTMSCNLLQYPRAHLLMLLAVCMDLSLSFSTCDSLPYIIVLGSPLLQILLLSPPCYNFSALIYTPFPVPRCLHCHSNSPFHLTSHLAYCSFAFVHVRKCIYYIHFEHVYTMK